MSTTERCSCQKTVHAISTTESLYEIMASCASDGHSRVVQHNMTILVSCHLYRVVHHIAIVASCCQVFIIERCS